MNRIASAAILAGGLSSRMGQDKALLEVDGEPLIQRTVRTLAPLFEHLIVVTNHPEVAQAANIEAVPDAHSNKGQLAGIEAALTHFQSPVFIVACDLLFLSADLIRFQCSLWQPEWNALVAQSEHGNEPLHAIWSNSALSSVRSFLEADRRPSLHRVLGNLKVESLTLDEARRFSPDLRCFENWNTHNDVKI